MPPLHLLIKPSSSNCNMRCTYCFYFDLASKREIQSYGNMNFHTLELIVKKALQFAESECSFYFQGGEPTLVGLEFYHALIRYVAQYNTKKLTIHYGLQTNGYTLTREWVNFFAAHKFLIGISLDGPKEFHDRCRLDTMGKSTFNRVMQSIQLLNSYHVDYNVLVVVTKFTAKNIRKIYEFFKRNGIIYQQYIPCLDPLGEERGTASYSLTPDLYKQFLTSLFDLWYLDMQQGNYIYIRYFENLVGILKGHPPEACSMMGVCSNQYIIESNGSVYPCDFYVIDNYQLGTVLKDDFEMLKSNSIVTRFIEPSLSVSKECKLCKWLSLCRRGCRRERILEDGLFTKNYFCEAFQHFFKYSIERLQTL